MKYSISAQWLTLQWCGGCGLTQKTTTSIFTAMKTSTVAILLIINIMTVKSHRQHWDCVSYWSTAFHYLIISDLEYSLSLCLEGYPCITMRKGSRNAVVCCPPTSWSDQHKSGPHIKFPVFVSNIPKKLPETLEKPQWPIN